jgi:cytidylate kinase
MAILTITKQFGSGGGEIGSAVANLLGYEYIPLKRVFEEAGQAGNRIKKLADEVSKSVPGLWERTDWSFLAFVAFSQSTILNYALQNNIVVMTRGGNMLLRSIPHALRILVTAPFDVRVRRIMEREELSEEIAVMMAKKADREMAVTIQQIYGTNWMDPTEYDQVIDTSKQNWNEIARSLKDSLMAKEKDFTAEAQKILNIKALATYIKVKIMTSPAFITPTLEVETKGDILVISGVVRNPDQHKRIEEEVKKLAGDRYVEFHIHYRGSWPFRGI